MKAAAYARYSTEHQTSSSIAYQMRRIEEYCQAHSITITARYADEARSGTNTDRPAFQELCQAARQYQFEAVVIYDISRGSRDVSDWFSFRKQMAVLGIQVISVEDRIGDILNPSDYLTELITVGLGQHHVLTSRQKSMDSIATKAKTGQFLGGYPNFGYDVKNGQYVINPAEVHNLSYVRLFNIYMMPPNEKTADRELFLSAEFYFSSIFSPLQITRKLIFDDSAIIPNGLNAFYIRLQVTNKLNAT